MEMKQESEKVGLKLNIQKTKIMESGPIIAWQIDGETVADFIFWAPKSLQMVIAAMKLKDTPWKVSYDQLRQHIKKQRHYFVNKVPYNQGYGFSSGHVWMWELDYKEIWLRRIDAFEPLHWRRLLRVPWTARRSNQSILKEINPGCSLKGLMLKLKLQYFGHLMWRADSLEKTLMLGKIEGRRGATEDEMVGWPHPLNGHGFGWTPGVGHGQGGLVCCHSWYCRVGHDWVIELNW